MDVAGDLFPVSPEQATYFFNKHLALQKSLKPRLIKEGSTNGLIIDEISSGNQRIW